jgi:type I restriction enzyme S subunit
LLLDLQGVPYLSRKRTHLAESLRIEAGWTLISCSGTIGRTAYVRQELAGMLLSQHAIRAVLTDPEVDAGYLFAYLSAGHAQAMIKQRTYGSIVQHIEPEHIGDIPVPIPSGSDQSAIGDLVRHAATGRTEASRLLDLSSAYFDALVPSLRFSHEHQRAEFTASRIGPGRRLDAFYHAGWAAEGRSSPGDLVGEVATVSRPALIKRIFVERGVPFISGVDVYQVRPSFRARIMSIEAERAEARVAEGMIVVQRSGQRYGLLGRPAYIGTRLHGVAASEDLMRISPKTPAVAARIFAFLRSESGRRSLLRLSYGTSIPHFNQEGLASVAVPDLPSPLIDGAMEALRLRERADKDEELAIKRVEAWLDS